MPQVLGSTDLKSSMYRDAVMQNSSTWLEEHTEVSDGLRLVFDSFYWFFVQHLATLVSKDALI